MANLCKPITAYDFQVRYNNISIYCTLCSQLQSIQYKTNMPCQCGYPGGMSPRGRMVFPRAPPSGKPSGTFQSD